jgi:hypothetical protein
MYPIYHNAATFCCSLSLDLGTANAPSRTVLHVHPISNLIFVSEDARSNELCHNLSSSPNAVFKSKMSWIRFVARKWNMNNLRKSLVGESERMRIRGIYGRRC